MCPQPLYNQPENMMDTSAPAPQGKFDAVLTRLPLAWLSLAFVFGILAASRMSLATGAWLGAAGAVLLLAIITLPIFKRRGIKPFGLSLQTWFLLTACLGMVALGAARYQAAQPDLDASHIAWYNGGASEVVITGSVDTPPDVRDSYTNLRLRVRAVDSGGGDVPVGGLVLVRLEGDETYTYGEVLRLRGVPGTPLNNEEFSYQDYLARQGIHSLMISPGVTRLPFPVEGNPLLRGVYAVKERALVTIYAIFPDPEASLEAGILLGVDRGLPLALQQAFKNTGTSHIIAISGFNITIIAALFMTLFSRLLGRRRGPWVAVAAIVLYTLLVGAEATVVRAALMGTLGLFARQVGRRQTGLNTLTFTAALMCVLNPFTPWDVGFQLSFFATLGLILYAQPWHDWTVGVLARVTLPETARRIARPLAEYFLFTLAAQLTTLPILAWHFGRISLVSLLVNPLILPVQPAVMVLGGLALLMGSIYIPLGRLFAWVAWPFPAYTIRIVELFDRIPGGVLVLGEFSFLVIVTFYTLLFAWTFSRGRLKQVLRTAATPAVLLTGLSIAIFLTASAIYAAPDGRLHILFLEAGSAEAVLIETPSGRYVLVNGGSSPSALSASLGERLSPFDRRLDWLIIASPQEGQVAALPRTLERFELGNALWAGNRQASYSARRVDEWLSANSVPVVTASAGDMLDLGQGARLEVMRVSPRGAVLLVEWGEFRALLPIGMDFDSLEALENGKAIRGVDVLLLADAGYAALNPEGWLEQIQPQVFVLSVAADDPNGLPDEETLALTTGRTLLRTDQNGWIEVTTDGHDLWLSVER